MGFPGKVADRLEHEIMGKPQSSLLTA